ncbi:bacterial group 2 Ig-like protein [Eubacterium sp. CAG:252]|nr:bacterial group 2 Ig-like protein [Eubacterium sp. CAG:252]
MGYGGSNKYANIFEAKANQDGSENIKAVSFMTGRSTNLNYTVSIYTNLTDETNPESGTLAAQKSGITTYDGTYTVNLDSPVEINEGNKFSVVVEVRNASGKTSYLAYERSMQSGRAGYWCTASAKENQSFIATPYGYWDDFGKARSCNFIIKAFTDNETQTPVVEVESVSLNKSEMTLTEGKSETLAATVTPENAENKSITWSSNNEAVATVDVNGTVTAKSAGTAVITATSTNGKSAGCTVTVEKKQIPVTEVRLSESTVGIVEGSTYKLTATVLPENTTDSKNVSWSSNNEAVATVDANGTVTAKSAGTAVITATSTNGKSAGCTVTVEKKQIPVTEVRLSESTVGIVEGSTYKLTATVLPENTTDSKSVSWSSSNSEVATVDANGTVTAKRAGTAVITATSTNGKTAGCTVTVSKKEIPITEISLDKSSATLTEGETTTLVATVLPENTTYGKSVKWSSSNVAVATVDIMGKVTAKSAGTAIITATSENGKTASCTITVNKKDTNITITEVRLNKSTETLTEGDTTTLTATVLPENTTYGKSVKWSSSNVAVATVDIMGKVTAKSAGTAVITATSTNGKSAGCTVTVEKKQIPVTEVRLSESTVGIVEGSTYKLTATVLPENTTDSKSVSWSSSNSEVATVDANGTVTAKRAGTAVITATSTNGKTAGCTVTVSKKEIPITEISLDKSSATLTEGETTTLVATVLPENTTYGKSVKWSSSNVAVATVDIMGKVTAKSAGTAIITATSENGKTASCTITVNKKDTNITITEVRLNKSTETLTEGDTTTLTATVLPENTTYGKSVKWSSSNVAVATVDIMGKVTAKSAGTAIITATSENGKTASCTVTVNKKDTYTGLRDVDGNWMYFENGNVNSDYAGLVNYEGLWFYVDNGTIDWGYTGLADYNGIWFYVSGGMVDWNYTGLTYYNDVWFYVSGGMINWDYTGLVYYNDIWFYVSGGILDWDYIGLTYYNDIWFVISGGMINWDYAGLIYYNDMWFYVSGGTINWDYAGLIYYNDAWFYVSGGCINWTTAIVDYNGAKFYVQNGMVDWDYTGTVDYNGTTYRIVGGMVV